MNNKAFTVDIPWIRAILIGLSLSSPVYSADSPREKLSMDLSWKFTNGDPSDVGNLFDYQESDLKKLNLKSEKKEAELAPKRADAVKTNPGGQITWVKPEFDDAKWRTVNLPHDWAIEMPFSRAANNGKGSKQLDEKDDAGNVQTAKQAGNVTVNVTTPGLKVLPALACDLSLVSLPLVHE
jgi:hypothetical protein